jgi:prepilin-type N-terminal cleavage/methylation domain-containing protein
MRRAGFTLLEVIIAMSIASFVLFAVAKGLAHATDMYVRGRDRIALERSATSVLDQLEKDLLTATMPTFPKPEPKKPKEGNPDPKDAKDSGPASPPEKKKEPPLFWAQSHEEDTFTFGEDKYQVFEKLMFYNHSPIAKRGRNQRGLVWVTYVLEQDKQLAKQDIASYRLYRIEQLKDRGAPSEDESSFGAKKKVSQPKPLRLLIADRVAQFSMQYVMQEAASKQNQDQEPKIIESFSWGDISKTKKRLPDLVRIHLTLWDENYRRKSTFETMVPMLTSAPDPKRKTDGKSSGVGATSFVINVTK